jgi:hypothetical protein
VRVIFIRDAVTVDYPSVDKFAKPDWEHLFGQTPSIAEKRILRGLAISFEALSTDPQDAPASRADRSHIPVREPFPRDLR